MRLHTLQLLIEAKKKELAALVNEYKFITEKNIKEKTFTKVSIVQYDVNKKSE